MAILLVLRYFWFLCAVMMLANVVIWRGRLAHAVELGIVTNADARRFLRGAVLGLVVPCILLGGISLAAGWSDPFCAGVLSFRGTARAAASLVLVGTGAALLLWTWVGTGAELLGRVAPALSNRRSFGQPYSPMLVRAAATALLLIPSIGAAVTWHVMEWPKAPNGCAVADVSRESHGKAK